ncbi:TRAP transporter small permease [Nocardioides sp. W7]|uniref:TRAP transporter small permease n=1 Tax=Nocardioides sp. W7 TaxID=2931390 RepID=UPI001FD0D091|nr:TRAP transporter small permease [Nocardioides sp. W7]
MAENATQSKVASRGFELLIEVPAVLITFLMMLHVTANAVMRTWFDSPIDNTLEMVEYWYLPLVAFLGFIAAQHRGQHIAADLVFEMLPAVTKRFVLAFVFVLCSVVVAGFAWFGWGEAMHAKEIGKTAGVSDLIAWPAYFLVPLAFGSLTIQFLVAAWRALLHPEQDHFVSDVGDAAVLDALASDEATRDDAVRLGHSHKAGGDR